MAHPPVEASEGDPGEARSRRSVVHPFPRMNALDLVGESSWTDEVLRKARRAVMAVGRTVGGIPLYGGLMQTALHNFMDSPDLKRFVGGLSQWDRDAHDRILCAVGRLPVLFPRVVPSEGACCQWFLCASMAQLANGVPWVEDSPLTETTTDPQGVCTTKHRGRINYLLLNPACLSEDVVSQWMGSHDIRLVHAWHVWKEGECRTMKRIWTASDLMGSFRAHIRCSPSLQAQLRTCDPAVGPFWPKLSARNRPHAGVTLVAPALEVCTDLQVCTEKCAQRNARSNETTEERTSERRCGPTRP